MKDLYKLEGSEKPEKLGPKLDSNGDMVPKATKLKAYDEKSEEILKHDSYIGRGSCVPNIGNKLKLAAAHLLGKYMKLLLKSFQFITKELISILMTMRN